MAQNDDKPRTRTETREDGTIMAVAGMSRSGKTASVIRDVRGHKRVCIWDLRGDYVAAGFERVTTIRELADRIAGTGPARIAYMGRPADFAAWAELCYLWIQERPATIIADETAQVTTPAKAPPGWHLLLTQGAYWGAIIVGITQTPTESDKTIWSNAHLMRCFAILGEDNRNYMARRLHVAADRLPTEPLAYLEATAQGDIREQKLTF